MVSAVTRSAAHQASAWAQKLSTLLDPSLQVGWLRFELERSGAARAADVLSVVLARAEQRDERHAALLLRVSLALAAPGMSALKRAIAIVAEVRGQHSLSRFLGHAGRDAEPEGDEDAPRTAREVIDLGEGRPLSLGERKSLARTHDRSLLLRIMRDPSADVIRILLDNPAVIEADVVRLCARRPARALVLSQVFQHRRWILRYRVRLTLALNPYTPEDVALQLLPHLNPADLRMVAQSSQVSERVRAACTEKAEKPLH